MNRLSAILLLLPLLAGCQRTLFEQAPGVAVDCDPRLVGRWLSIADGDGDDGEFEATVTEQCTVTTVEQRNEGPRTSAPTQMRVHRLGRQTLLVIDAHWANASFDVDPGPFDQAGNVYLLAWEARGSDRLRLLPVDHQELAARAIAGKLKADVLQQDGSLTVRVRDVAQQHEALQRRGVFDRSKALQFRRAEAPSP